MEGIRHCHECGIIHRDIKSSNILINYNGNIKLCDFGLGYQHYSTHSSLIKTNRVITIWYRPPEILLGSTQYYYSVDIWSCCCIFLEIFLRHSPFQGYTDLATYEHIINVCGMPNDPRYKNTNEWSNVCTLPFHDKFMEYIFHKWNHNSNFNDNNQNYNNDILTNTDKLPKRVVLNDPYLITNVPKMALQLADFMFTLDPMRRPTAQDVLNHPYFLG